MLDRTLAPAFNRSVSFDLIDPGYLKLNNGVEVYYIPGGDQNVIKVELVFAAGRWYEPVWGACHFTTNLLNKGTTTKSSFEVASLFDQLGAHLDISAGVDFVTISLYSLTKKLGAALNLLTEILQQPSFPEKELQQGKSIFLQNLKVNHEKTSYLASNLFRKTIFGTNHPYGKELEEEDVQNITREDLVYFHQHYLKDFKIFVSGKIDDTNKRLIAQAFETFQTVPSPEKNHEPLHLDPLSLYTEKEGSVQTSLRVGKKSIPRTHPDYTLLLFLTHILGGYFGSRLMKNIREEKGLTYGIYSSIHTMKHNGYIVIGTDVNKENKDVAFSEIRKELQRLHTEAIGEDELDIARWHFIGSLQTELSTSFAHADKIKNIVLFNLPKDHYTRLVDKLSRVAAWELQEAAIKYFQEKEFFQIAVG